MRINNQKKLMKNLLLSSFLVLATLANEAQTVAVVDFMKVPGNGQDAYLAVEKQWKSLHQNRIQSGAILGWELYYVRNSGTSSPYNFVTVTIYPNFAKTEASISADDFKKAFGNNSDELMKKTTAARNLIYSETYQLQVGILSNTPDKYIVVNSMHTDNLDKYLNMEKVGYMPMHEEAKKSGKLNSWGIWTRWPNEDNSVQAVAVDGYTNFSDINNMDYNDILGKVMADKKPSEVYDMLDQVNKTDAIRTIVKSEIWDLLDATTSKM
jgi:hypothetical protein